MQGEEGWRKEQLLGNLVGMGLRTAGTPRAWPRSQERSLDLELRVLDLNQVPAHTPPALCDLDLRSIFPPSKETLLRCSIRPEQKESSPVTFGCQINRTIF